MSWMRGRVIATMLALATGGCGASALATISSGKPVIAGTRPEPQLALTRIKTANSPARPVTDLIVVTLGSWHDNVVSAGSRRGWPEPLTQPVTWSPDGRRVAFARITSRELKDAHGYSYYRTDIFIINANGSVLWTSSADTYRRRLEPNLVPGRPRDRLRPRPLLRQLLQADRGGHRKHLDRPPERQQSAAAHRPRQRPVRRARVILAQRPLARIHRAR